MSPSYLPVSDDVLSIIGYLRQQNAALELTKSFKGVLVQQDVSILEVNPDEASFRVTDTEMCAALEGDVYLNSQLLPKPVTAQIKSLNLKKGTLVLSGFAYFDIEWKKRRHERVQPKKLTFVNLQWKRKVARACIANISVDGMGLFAYKLLEHGLRLQPGSEVQLNFELPPDRKYSALKGEIIYINPIGSFTAAIGIRLLPKAKQSRLLGEYVALRKQEIMEELNRAYWELSRPRGVESLYF